MRKRIIHGVGAAAIITALFFRLAGELNPGRINWMLLPVIIVPAVGGVGGMAFYITDPVRRLGGWRKAAANTLSLLAYVFIVLVAFIAALNGPN